MEIPKSQSLDAEPTETVQASAPISAIQKQQAAELLHAKGLPPASATSDQPLAGIKQRKKPGLFVFLFLTTLFAIVLFYYEGDFLTSLARESVLTEPVQEEGQLQRQLERSRQLSPVLIHEPYRLGELLGLYRDILLESPDHPEANSGLQQLPRQSLLLVSYFMASGQMDSARKTAEDALLYFPELSDDPLWQQLVVNIPDPAAELPVQQEIAEEESAKQSAEESMPTQGVLIAGPASSELAPLPEQPVVSETTAVPSKAADTVEETYSTQQDEINRLLQEARDFEQKGIQFTQRENTVTRYQEVLVLEPGQVEAASGLKALIENRVAYVKRLLDEKDLDKAKVMLEPALDHFPQHPELLALSSQIDNQGGFISSLEVDFLPASAMDPALVAVGGQTLLLTFSYKYFPGTTTVVNAKLFHLPSLDTIAGVPVILQDPRGSKSVQMNTLTSEIEDGRYQLILSSGGKELKKYEFSVANNIISNDL